MENMGIEGCTAALKWMGQVMTHRHMCKVYVAVGFIALLGGILQDRGVLNVGLGGAEVGSMVGGGCGFVVGCVGCVAQARKKPSVMPPTFTFEGDRISVGSLGQFQIHSSWEAVEVFRRSRDFRNLIRGKKLLDGAGKLGLFYREDRKVRVWITSIVGDRLTNKESKTALTFAVHDVPWIATTSPPPCGDGLFYLPRELLLQHLSPEQLLRDE